MAYEFVTPSFLSMVDSSALDLGLSGNSYSLAFNYRRDAAGDQYLAGKGGGAASPNEWNATNGHQWFVVIVASIIYMQWRTGGGGIATLQTAAPSVGQRQHLCFTYNGSTTNVFKDAVNAASQTGSYARPTTTFTLIGAIANATSPAAVSISDFAVWQNAALTDAEITALARGFTPDQIRPQSLSFYAPLVRNLQDVRGGLAITNNNSATVATHPRIIT